MDFFSDIKDKFSNCGRPGAGESIAHIPQQFTIKGRQIQEEKLLTEGAFGYIWRARDVRTNEIFALKRMMCMSEERLEVAKTEMRILERLPKHQNIVNYYGGSIIPDGGITIAVFLMELCEGGSLFELMEKKQYSKFSENEIINIIKQVAKGANSLHSLHPPMAHRDIKIENVLISNSVFKVCDFGSSSSQAVDFSQVSQSDYIDHEEVFEKTTTPMYRPPEICDPYLGYLVNEKVDVWMIGCVMYTLCFYIHPFVEGQKLGICEAKFTFPQDSKFSEKLHDLIRHMLTPNPRYRPSVVQVSEILNQWNYIQSVPLNQQAQEIKKRHLDQVQEEQNFNKNKRQINDDGGEISMEEIMRMQKKIQSEQEGDSFSFANQRQKKVQQQKLVQDQLKRNQKGKQQQSSTQNKQNSSNNSNNNSTWGNFGSNSTNSNKPQNANNFGSNSGQVNKPQNQNQQWDSWNNTTAQTNQQNNSNNSGWDQQWNSNNGSSNNQTNNNNNNQEWDSWNNNTNQQQPQYQQTNQQNNNTNGGWDNVWNQQQPQQQQQQSFQQQQPQQQQQQQQWNQQPVQQQQQQWNQQPVQQQQQPNFEEDLLGIGDSGQGQKQSQQQKDVDITDLIF